MLNLNGRTVLVVGGGKVGRRKAAAARDAGAHVVVVDPRPASEDFGPGVARVVEPFAARHLDGVAMAFACVGPEVNACVAEEARARGVWVCSSSSPPESDFILPATLQRGQVTLSASTSGASPALARRIRDRWEAEYDDAFGAWVTLLGEMRDEVKQAVPDPNARRVVLEALSDWGWLDRLRADGAEAVGRAMRAFIRDRP